MAAPLLSILVPAGPGDRSWLALWPQLPEADCVERLLVLAEGDAAAPQPKAAKVLHAPAGRARQLNAGLAAASGNVVWMLHADSRLSSDTVASALEAASLLHRSGARALGWFPLAFHDGPPQMALNALGANLRSQLFGMPYGDQGLLAPRQVLADLGGFDETLGRGEDHALVWQAHRAGLTLMRLRGCVSTSARRYVERGWWRTSAEHLRLSWQQRRVFSRASTP
ncbi:MAG: glycosyl transferase family 2 [Aquimonas sp.]|nr:glycosyl transferase family 2 [Aquimonas sp.]